MALNNASIEKYLHTPTVPLRMAVVGLGHMGLRHARVIRASPLADLVAVADHDIKRLQERAAMLEALPYGDYNELLQRDDIQAVVVCTPDKHHLAPCLAAARAGKHLLVEKPLAADLSEATAIIDACREEGVKLMAAHLLRFDPRYLAIKAAILDRTVGEVLHISAHRNSPWTSGPARYAIGTSLTLHLAVHDLDLVNWYIGSRPVTIYARNVRRKLAHLDTDDAVSAVIAFESGAVANLQYSWVLPPTSVTPLDARLELIGEEGMALVGGYHGQGVFIASADRWSAPDVHHAYESLAGQLLGDVREEVHAFIDCVLHDRPSPVPGEEALLAVREAVAIEESLRTGDVIRLVG